MIKELKFLKRCLKRKINVTTSLLVIFLITGSIGYTKEINNEDIFSTVIVKDTEFENNGSISVNDGNAVELEKDNVKITNNEKISGEVKQIIEDIDKIIEITKTGNGVIGKKITEVNNNGIIRGEVEQIIEKININTSKEKYKVIGSGNGIGSEYSLYESTIIENINNNGIIEGKLKQIGGTIITTEPETIITIVDNRGSGNGIIGNGMLETNNNGIIKGEVEQIGREIKTTGMMSGAGVYSEGSGNGIIGFTFFKEGNIGNIKNKGIIKGEINQTGGIATTNEIIDNQVDGDILSANPSTGAIATALGSSNGISSYGTFATSGNRSSIKNISNEGIILGSLNQLGGNSSTNFILITDEKEELLMEYGAHAYTKALGSGNGISSYSALENSNIGNIKNKGIIKGELAQTGGISNKNIDVTLINAGIRLGPEEARMEGVGSGNGISSYSNSDWRPSTEENKDSNIEDINNEGIISGRIEQTGGTETEITNLKIEKDKALYWGASVDTSTQSEGSGNGISNYASSGKSSIGKINNSGVLSGYIQALSGEGNGKIDYVSLSFSGNGIANSGDISNNIANNGIIKGSTSAIAAQSISGTVTNNGILSGREIFGNGNEIHKFESTDKEEKELKTITPTNEINNGIYVKLESETSEKNDGNATGNVKTDTSGNPIIEEIKIGTGGKVTLEDGTIKTVINGSAAGEKTISEVTLNKKSDNKMDIYLSSSNLDTTSNVIINGTGMEKGALVVDSETTLTDSIVNGYNTGVYLEQGKFTAINTTINGGGLKNDVAVLKGDENGNIAEVLGTSVINGKVELGAGEDSLTIGNSVQINGDLDGGTGEDNLKLGDKELSKTESSLNIYHNINDFENIVFEGNTTLYETSKISGTTDMKIDSGTQVNLRIDSSIKDEDGTYKTHAIYNSDNNKLTISGDTDKITEDDVNNNGDMVVEENENEDKYDKVSILNLVTNGLGREAIIDLGNVKIEDTVWVKTDSIINQATKNETEDGTTITIEAEKDLFSINKKFGGGPEPDPSIGKYYIKLNDIYKGIHSSNDNNFNALNAIITGTLTEANKGDYTTITDEQQMATLLAYLKQVYTETPYSFSAEASRKSMNVFGDIVKENNFKAKDGEIITYGGLTHNNGEGTDKYYGKNYHGFDIGSADTKVDSKMTGAYGQIEKGISDSTAVGLMLGGNNNKVDIATSDLKGNSAYLSGYVKHDKGAFRGIAGIGIQYSDWDSHRNTMSDSYKENYSDRGLNIYAEGKYTKELTEGLFLEPKVGVSYDYIKQESINESKDKALALEVDGKDFDTLSGNVGLDLRKEIVTEKGKHNLTAGVNYTRILSGADEDNLTGNFGGNSFDILVPQKTKDNVSVGIKYDIELETGVMLGAKVSYDVPFKVSQDNHTHKNEGSWKVGVGIGYKF